MMNLCEKAMIVSSTLKDAVSLMTKLNYMRLEGSSHDSVLKTQDGGFFPVHRIVLISTSEYFKALFTSTLNNDDRSEILVPSVKADTLSRIINFAYAQPLEFQKADIWDLIVTSDMLLYKPLLEKCYQYLWSSLTPDTCLQLYQHSRAYRVTEFEGQVKTYVVDNFYHVSRNKSFVEDVSAESLASILEDDRLCVKEEVIWEVVQNWLEISDDRQDHIIQLIGCIRLAYLDRHYIFSKIMCHPIVMNCADCRLLIGQRQSLMWSLAQTFYNGIVDTPYIGRPRMPRDLLFAVGGYSRELQKTIGQVEVYDCKANLWLKVNNGNDFDEVTRESHVCVFLDESIYVLGGEKRKPMDPISTVYCWNLVKKEWKSIPSMQQDRANFSAVAICGTIVVIGGWQSDGGTLRTVEQYSPMANKWKFLQPMTCRRCSAAATVIDNQIFVCGGSTNRVDCLASVEIYNSVTRTWNNVHPMDSCRRGASATVYNGRVVVAGGKHLSSVEAYDAIADNWNTFSLMLDTRHFFSLAVLDNVLYAIGGSKGSHSSDHMCGIEEYDESSRSWKSVYSDCSQVVLRGFCVVRSLANASDYLHPDRGNLLEVKGENIRLQKEKGQFDEAKIAAMNIFPKLF